MTQKIGFLMEQTAGHVTNYRNLRAVADRDPTIEATWNEIVYEKDGGRLETLRERLPFLPAYPVAVTRAVLEVHRALRHKRYDAIYSNASVGLLFSKRFRKTPTLIDLDSTPLQIDRMPSYGSPVDSAPIAHLKWRLCRNMLHAAAVVHAWSRWAKSSAVNDYGVPEQRVVVNPPGVDLGFWGRDPGAERSAQGPFKVLFVGGDFRRKGGDVLLKWYRSSCPANIELHLVTREPVEPASGVFVYPDMQPNTQRLLELYQKSHVFVLPSLGECFGIATVEAMAAGLPVIASDVGGTADIIEPGRNGEIVPAGDDLALGQAISGILSAGEGRQRMARESRKLAEERFDVERNARRTLGYLKEIAERGPRQS